jgi:hypothetical protein
MSDKKVPVLRPVIITVFCSLLFAVGVFTIIYTFTGVFAPYGVYYSAVNTFIIVIMFAALSGVWVMEKWGAYLFAVLVLVKLGIDFYAGAFTWWELLLLVPALVFLSGVKKMK